VHAVPGGTGAVFSSDYKTSRSALGRLYERAKASQWNARTDLPWETDVDPERVARANAERVGGYSPGMDVTGTPAERWSDREWLAFGVESHNWTMSQFLHGEQGALVCTAKIVETAPWIDAKTFAATQVMDEARHVEVFNRYLHTKLSGPRYPVNPSLQSLLDGIVGDSRWDITFLGMQVMIEGLALAAFDFISGFTTEPLLQQMLAYVTADEARHVAFGVVSLREVYAGLSAREIRDRQDFACEAAVCLRDRVVQAEVWEHMGVPAKVAQPRILGSSEHRSLNTKLFSRIVPNCANLGLLDAGDGWLRRKFAELGILDLDNSCSVDGLSTVGR